VIGLPSVFFATACAVTKSSQVDKNTGGLEMEV